MPDGERGIVDWGLALRLGRRLAGDSASPLDEAEVRETSREALEMALAYTTLEPARRSPRSRSSAATSGSDRTWPSSQSF